MLFKLFITKARAMTNYPGFSPMRVTQGLQKIPAFLMCVFSGLLMLASSSAFAVTLQNVDFQSESGGKLQINLQFDGVPPEPSTYNI